MFKTRLPQCRRQNLDQVVELAVPVRPQGIKRLIRAHLDWVVEHRAEARYLFEISRGDWTEELRDRQRALNARFAEGIERWRAPLVARGELLPLPQAIFGSQVIGPAQIFCRAYLSGRERGDVRQHAGQLVACAIRALVADSAKGDAT